MSYNKNDNDLNNINISKISQIHLNNQEKLKKQKELLQESGYSSETDPDIIENTGMDFDYSQEDDLKKQKKNRFKKFNREKRNTISPNKQINYKNQQKIKNVQRLTNSKEKIEKKEISPSNLKKEKKSPSETANDLFKKAMKNTKKTTPYELGNTQTTKISEILYEKFVNQNDEKSKHVDVLSKLKDEEVLQDREALRTKDDVKKINDMINRQEEFEKLKSTKLKEKEKEVINKINQECVFNPNGISTTSRTPMDFYNEQLKFIEKKDNKIRKLTQDILDNEKYQSNILLTSKNNEKFSSAKNSNENKGQLYNRVVLEKYGSGLKEIPEAINEDNSRSNIKKLTKGELNNLSNKLYQESNKFKNNLEKKRKEKLMDEMKNNKKEFALKKSNKVLLDKFILNYDKILLEIFNQNKNFEISYDDYKKILYKLGCIKQNSINDENLVKDSFYNYLKPNNDKIDTYSFLIFGLATLGIYKGNDEKEKLNSIQVITTNNINNNKKQKIYKNNTDINIETNLKQKNKTSIDLIKSYIPDIDLNKYGYTNKITKIIKQKFLPFSSGISEMWADDLIKKKQERIDKSEELIKKQEEQRKTINKEKIKNNFQENNNNNSNINNNNLILNTENFTENLHQKENNDITKSAKLENNYQMIQKKQKFDISLLKAKYDAKELENCTFQPNSLTKPVNKNQISKKIEKLYNEGKNSYIKKKQMSERNPDENPDNAKNCTFKPVIHEYKKELFQKNPLKTDKNYNNKIQQLEKIREQNRNKSASKEYEKPMMSFAIEPKLNKENIIDRINSNKNKNDKIDFLIDETGGENFKPGVIPLLKVEVNLNDKNNCGKLFIYSDDDVIQVVNDFCKKNNLDDEKKNILYNIIMEKVKVNNNINIIENKNEINENKKLDKNWKNNEVVYNEEEDEKNEEIEGDVN